MTTKTPTSWQKWMNFLGFAFIVLFFFRLAYGYTTTDNNSISISETLANTVDFSSVRKNYASKSYKKGGPSNGIVRVDQKYEKIADISTKSADFDSEEKTARNHIKSFDALIQFEQKRGNKGHRQLNLIIGVPPQNFDSLYQQLILLGKVQAKKITKNDKTNEYKSLNAKKLSLEKIRASLIELKSKGGKIEEYMNLENRILEIEQELQSLGVSLGNFDDENEFCTIKFALTEGKIAKISLMHRLKVAFQWTVKWYLSVIAILFFASGFAFMSIRILEKLQMVKFK